jgi:hypothetical protein
LEYIWKSKENEERQEWKEHRENIHNLTESRDRENDDTQREGFPPLA